MRRTFIAIIAGVAILQWAVVLERACAAVWAWYKFVGYGGGGHIVVGWMTQVVFLLGSIALATIGHALFTAESRGGASVFWSGLAQFGWLAISVCILVWVVFLLSPIVTFQRT